MTKRPGKDISSPSTVDAYVRHSVFSKMDMDIDIVSLSPHEAYGTVSLSTAGVRTLRSG
jgi:hypothetical protein